MKTFTHIVTSSKLRRIIGCNSLHEALECAAELENMAPSGRNDCEIPVSIYTWPEWIRIAEENESDPITEIENK